MTVEDPIEVPHGPPSQTPLCQVDGAPGEVPGFQPLLRDLDLAGVVITADALQAQTHRSMPPPR